MPLHVYAVFDTRTAADLAALHIRHALPDARIKSQGKDDGGPDDGPGDGVLTPFWLSNGTNAAGTPNYYAPYPAVMGSVWGGVWDGDGDGDGGNDRDGREHSTQASLSVRVHNGAEADVAARLMREMGGTGVRRTETDR